MPKLRRVSGKEAVAALEKLGFVQVRPNFSVPPKLNSFAD
jgi:predicted RNA binding protein YcfA (HicA-like mRNA interferase family)